MMKPQKQNNYLNWQSKLAEDNLNKALEFQRDEFEQEKERWLNERSRMIKLLFSKGITSW